MKQLGDNSSNPAGVVVNAINTAFKKAGHFLNEAGFQSALYEELKLEGPCNRECRAEFSPIVISTPNPPKPFLQKDVCEARGQRKIDLVVVLDSSSVAIELKFSRFTQWKGSHHGVPLPNPSQSDVVAYHFLKDIHRMERLAQVSFKQQRITPNYRICALLSNNPFETEAKILHEQMRLYPRKFPAGHLVQFNKHAANGKPTSPNTLWRDYPPFCLAQSYEIKWTHVGSITTNLQPADNERRAYPPFQLLVINVP